MQNVKDVTDILKIKKKKGFPKIDFQNEQVISEQTAYQMTSILKGVITRGTGKKLKDLKGSISR